MKAAKGTGKCAGNEEIREDGGKAVAIRRKRVVVCKEQ